MTAIGNFLRSVSASVADTVNETTDPDYVKAKEYLSRCAMVAEFATLVATVSSVALVLVGINKQSSGAIMSAGVCFYFSANGYLISQNLKRITDNPRIVCGVGGFGSVNKGLLLDELQKTTWYFNWFFSLFR